MHGSKTKIQIFFISVSTETWLAAFSKRFNIFDAFTQGGKIKIRKNKNYYSCPRKDLGHGLIKALQYFRFIYAGSSIYGGVLFYVYEDGTKVKENRNI